MVRKVKLVTVVEAVIDPLELEFYRALSRRLSFELIVSSRYNIPYEKSGLDFAKLDWMSFLPSPIQRDAPCTLCFLKNLEERLNDADVVLGQEVFSFLTYQLVKVASQNHIPCIVGVHETLSKSLFYRFPPYSWVTGKVTRRASAFRFLTRRAFHSLSSRLSTKMAEVIYPGVDLKEFSPMRKKRGHKKTRILFVGSLGRRKGLHLLLKAFSLVLKRESDVELLVAGRSGPLVRMVKEYARRNPHHIKYLGFVDRRLLSEVFRSSDIFCLPSLDSKLFEVTVWEEQFGYVLIEAMASGLPILATTCGAIPEVVGDCNILVKQDSPDAVYRGLMTLLRDEELRRRLSKENRRRVETTFNLNRQARKFSEFVLKVSENEFL